VKEAPFPRSRVYDWYVVLVCPSGAVRGYGTVRPGMESARIGPLFADEPHVAAALLGALLASLPHPDEADIVIPEPNESARLVRVLWPQLDAAWVSHAVVG
jgi:hypothetical protein